MKTLRIDIKEFRDLLSQTSKVAIVKNRNFQTGETINIQEYDCVFKRFTNRTLIAKIKNVAAFNLNGSHVILTVDTTNQN